MPSITDLVNAISANVIDRLSAASYPPLTDGKILLGRQYQFENSSPPRIVMIPTDSPFGPVDTYSARPIGSTEARRQNQQKAIWTEFIRFEVRCWGTSTASNHSIIREQDFDVTQALYHAFIQAAKDACGPFTNGGVMVEAGKWTDAELNGAQNLALGRELVFGLVVPTPILDHLRPYAPSDVTANSSTFLTDPDGNTSQGCGA